MKKKQTKQTNPPTSIKKQNGIINTLKNNIKEITKENIINLIKYSLKNYFCLSDDLLIFCLEINFKEMNELLLNIIFKILSNPTNKLIGNE